MCFNILTWKFASRRNGVHFFDISTSKNAPNLVCFVHFDLDMCFAPQRRALHFFDISTSKSGPRPSVFNTIDFEMCFAPQRRALFRCLNFYKSAPKLRCFDVFCAFWLRNVLRAATACNFSSLIWPNVAAPAALASEPTFRPSGGANNWKNTVNRDFCTFSPTCIFFPLTLSLLWSSLFFSPLLWLFPPLLFHVHIVGSLTSKLPSISRMSHKWSSFRRSTTRIWCRSAYTSYVASNQSGGSTCRSARMISKPIASTK